MPEFLTAQPQKYLRQQTTKASTQLTRENGSPWHLQSGKRFQLRMKSACICLHTISSHLQT